MQQNAGPLSLSDPPIDPKGPAPQVTPGERRALGICAAIAALAMLRVALPVGIGVLLGMLVAFTLQPLYRRLRLRTGRPGLAALSCVAVALFGVAGTMGVIGYLLVGRGLVIAQALLGQLGPGGAVQHYAGRFSRLLLRLHIQPSEVQERLRDAAASTAASLAQLAAQIAGLTLHALLSLFFMLLTLHYVLRNWRALERRAETVLPLAPHHTRVLFDEFSRVGGLVLLGTVLTGLAQGLLAALGYLICGVPEAAFLGAATAVASLIPAVGTLLVWLPAGLYLLLTGHVAAGVGQLIYATAVVVGLSDYVIRPALVGGRQEGPALLTFIALFGGVEAFGLIGLILGPVIMTLGLALLRTYEEERIRAHGGAP